MKKESVFRLELFTNKKFEGTEIHWDYLDAFQHGTEWNKLKKTNTFRIINKPDEIN